MDDHPPSLPLAVNATPACSYRLVPGFNRASPRGHWLGMCLILLRFMRRIFYAHRYVRILARSYDLADSSFYST